MDQKKEIICTFTSKLDQDFQVPQDQIAIPTEFSPLELTDLILSLLQSTNPQIDYSMHTFDFSVDGQILRTSLEELIVQAKLSRERTMIIEYMKQKTMPELDDKISVDDWIYKLHPYHQSVVAGLANGSVAIFKKGKKDVITLEDVAASAFDFKNCAESVYVASSYLDRSFRLDKLHLKNKSTFEDLASTLMEATISSIAFCKEDNSTLLCTGQTNGNVSIYDVQKYDTKVQQTSTKKVKREKAPLEAIKDFNLHKQQVSAVKWSKAGTIISGSYDHQIHLFNVQKEKTEQQLFSKNSVVLSIDINQDIILSGHEDGFIRQWDVRVNSQLPVKLQKNSKFSVSCVSCVNDNQYLTGSQDGMVNIWDMRASLPTYTISHPKTKILDVAGGVNNKIYCGGSENKLNIYSYSF